MSGVSSNSPKTHERDNWKNIEEIGPSIKNRTYGKIRPPEELQEVDNSADFTSAKSAEIE